MFWPRIDPRLGLKLCQACWDNGDRPHHCHKNGCECIKRGCGGYTKPLARPKFTGEGQTDIDLDAGEPLRIEANS
jgi:hypothetical protein